MRARTRRILTAVAVLWFAVAAWSLTVLPVSPAFNALLASLVVPLVRLLWEFAQFWINLHTRREVASIKNVYGTAGRPRPLPHQEAATR